MSTEWVYSHICAQGVEMILKKDSKREDSIHNFRLIILPNTELKMWAKVLAKGLVPVVATLDGETLICVIPDRTIQENLHLLRYTL